MNDANTLVLPRLGSGAVVDDPWGEDKFLGTDRPPAGSRRMRIAAWLVPGLLMGSLSVAGAATPGLRADELATWATATAAWPELWSTVHRPDLGGKPYYLLIRTWADMFGTSDLSLRAPSMLAMTAAAALIGALGSRVFAARTGLLAGVIFALLPASTRYAQEAGPHAFTLLAAVIATALFALMTQRPNFWYLAAYSASVSLLGLFHIVALALLVAHGWVVLAFARPIANRWLLAAFAGTLPAATLLAIGPDSAPAGSRPGKALQTLVAAPEVLFGAPVLAGILIALALFSLPLRRCAGIYTAWALASPLALLLIAREMPVDAPECLLFTLPAWATLGAAALGRVQARWGIASLLAIALIGLPNQIAFRDIDGHQQDTRRLAHLIETGMSVGDGVVYSQTDGESGWVARYALARYLPHAGQLKDVLTAYSRTTDGRLTVTECPDPGKCLGDTRRLWVIRLGERRDPLQAIGDSKERPLRTRYQVTRVWRLTGLTLALLVRKGADV